MENEIVPVNKTAVEVRAQVNLIQEVMKGIMKNDVHYGIIPGCKKPSLYKPGSEIILSTFKLACQPIVEDLSTEDEARYRVTANLVHMFSGKFIGAGIGECSSNESGRKWRKPVCKEEFDDTPEDRRREKWQSGYRGAPAKKVKQIRVEIADVANTILKMAKKRAQIDATLTATAASDIFTQDIEDIPSEVLGKNVPEPTVEGPKEKPEVPINTLAQKVFANKDAYLKWLEEEFKIKDIRTVPEESMVKIRNGLIKLIKSKGVQA